MSSDSHDDGAARYNQRVLAKLNRALLRHPDVDLTSALPSQYRSRLALKKRIAHEPECANLRTEADDRTSSPPGFEADHRISSPPHSPLPPVDESLPASVLYPLSTTVDCLLSGEEPRWSESSHLLSLALSRVLRSATVLFQSSSDGHHFVVRCSENLVAKAISTADSTEYSMLQFLETTSPDLPAPKPHRLLAVGKVWYMFMSYIPGVSLDTVWRSLEESQKRSLGYDLNAMLLKLREVPFEPGNMLGGVAGQGCKDTRRHRKTAPAPIYTLEGLWDFMYGCARNKETVYGKFLRHQTFPPREQRIILIHGDVRPANIMVRHHEVDRLQVTGLINWEMGGFYPEDLECVKALNNLSSIENDDWYLFLPECISPRKCLESWHADMVWDPYIT